MDNKQNLESYSDVENLNRFNEASFAEYCTMKLRTAESNVNFIKNHVFPGQALDNLNICEIGSQRVTNRNEERHNNKFYVVAWKHD